MWFSAGGSNAYKNWRANTHWSCFVLVVRGNLLVLLLHSSPLGREREGERETERERKRKGKKESVSSGFETKRMTNILYKDGI